MTDQARDGRSIGHWTKPLVMTPWSDEAACKDEDTALFFPEQGENLAVAVAKAVCAGCPVRSECLAYSLATPERFGIWGGLSQIERRRIRSARRRAS